jgi:hypothetical protein
MTCYCHDPLVFGHLFCAHWETQPKTANPLTTYWRPPDFHQAATAARAFHNLAQALRTPPKPPQPPATPPERRQPPPCASEPAAT